MRAKLKVISSLIDCKKPQPWRCVGLKQSSPGFFYELIYFTLKLIMFPEAILESKVQSQLEVEINLKQNKKMPSESSGCCKMNYDTSCHQVLIIPSCLM